MSFGKDEAINISFCVSHYASPPYIVKNPLDPDKLKHRYISKVDK